MGGFCTAMSMEGGRLPPRNHHYLPPLAQPHGDQSTGLWGWGVCVRKMQLGKGHMGLGGLLLSTASSLTSEPSGL